MDWIPRTTESQPADGEAFQRECGFSEPFFRVLWRRGIRTRDQAELFLHPERQPLPDPTALLDMDRTAALIKSAIAAEKKICIYGDYDVDGVCATTILYQTLATLGADVSYYIPLRAGEGYGMHAESVRQIAESGVQLLITVDNGISAHAEIALANSLGMKVIVTDHHRCHETLPDALAVVCASREGQAEEIRSLCGGAVALLLAIALGQPAERFLAIAALATVADVMPLTGFNRTIVARGMRLIHREPGLQALLDAAGAGDNAVTEMTLSFLLAPRVNAAGRMGDTRRAVELLLASDDSARRH
ncbi:MAG: DHH family phosphoesterase, partial [Clostridia bacterium]|nr:DHH family phosphoesterase [Clostridia bacterium]